MFVFMFIEAYSCGWRKGKKDHPQDSQKWRDGGNEARQKMLNDLRNQKVAVAKEYTLA